MRLSHKLPILFAVLVSFQVCLHEHSNAQELRNAVRDYRGDRVFNYRPDDPEHRGKVFNAHTGHSGRYYNCDGEECKRNSPYICWKPHTDKDIPTRVSGWARVKQDLAEVRQRVQDGAGKCYQENCRCADCRNAAASSQPTCGCADCDPPTRIEIESNESRQLVSQDAAPKKTDVIEKFGLVRGMIIEPTQVDVMESQPVRSATKPSSISELIRKR